MFLLLLLLFFISGATGLALETVWFRELGLIFGTGAFAQVTITATFLGGLGVGALAAARVGDRVRRPIFVYGLLESLVGLYAIFLPHTLDLLSRAQASIAAESGMGGNEMLARSLLIFLFMLPATLAMGASFPLVARAAIGPGEAGRGRLGALYGVNTLGAFLGALGTGFLLLPAFGQHGSTRVIALLIFAVALVAIVAGLTVETAARVKPRVDERQAPASSLAAFALTAVFLFVSGLSAMWIQTALMRALVIVLGASVYSFTLTLALTLAGIGLGGLTYGLLARRRLRGFGVLIVAQLLLAVGVWAAIVMAGHLPAALGAIARSAMNDAQGWYLWQAALAGLVSLLPSFAMGLSYPAALALYAPESKSLGRELGVAALINTAGSLIGVYGAAFLLIPSLGLFATLRAAAFLALGMALAFAAFTLRRSGWLRGLLALVGALALAALLIATPAPDPLALASGLSRPGLAERADKALDKEPAELLSATDGAAASVLVLRRANVTTMKINGKTEASDYYDMPTQVMVGALPLLAHPRREGLRAALVGYGSGVSAGAMLAAPLKSLDVIEIEPRVVEAAEAFRRVNGDPLADSRLSLFVGDARHHLAQSAARYDLIVSEPSNPWVSGASALFTVDFYRLAKARLAADGLFSQWIQLYELSPENFATLLRSFAVVFPYTAVFATSERGQDLVLLGSALPLRIDLPVLLARAQEERMQGMLARGGITSGYEALSLLAIAPEDLKEFVKDGPLNTDDNGLIEFAAPLDMLRFRDSTRTAVDFHLDPARGKALRLLGRVGDRDAERADNLGRLALALAAHGRLASAYETARQALRYAEDPIANDVAGIIELLAMKREAWPPLRNAWLVQEGAEDEGLVKLALAMSTGEEKEAYALAKSLAEERRTEPRLALLAGGLAYRQGETDVALAWLLPLAEQPIFMETWPETWFYLGRALDERMRFRESIKAAAHYLEAQRRRAREGEAPR